MSHRTNRPRWVFVCFFQHSVVEQGALGPQPPITLHGISTTRKNDDTHSVLLHRREQDRNSAPAQPDFSLFSLSTKLGRGQSFFVSHLSTSCGSFRRNLNLPLSHIELAVQLPEFYLPITHATKRHGNSSSNHQIYLITLSRQVNRRQPAKMASLRKPPKSEGDNPADTRGDGDDGHPPAGDSASATATPLRRSGRVRKPVAGYGLEQSVSPRSTPAPAAPPAASASARRNPKRKAAPEVFDIPEKLLESSVGPWKEGEQAEWASWTEVESDPVGVFPRLRSTRYSNRSIRTR